MLCGLIKAPCYATFATLSYLQVTEARSHVTGLARADKNGAVRVRACNYINLRLVGIIELLLKIVTRTAVCGCWT